MRESKNTLWETTTTMPDGDTQLTLSIVYNDSISNYDFVDVYMNRRKDGAIVIRIPVLNNAFKCGIMWPESSAGGNWFKMYIDGSGTAGNRYGGYAASTNLGSYTSYTGGMWGNGTIYKVVGVKIIA